MRERGKTKKQRKVIGQRQAAEVAARAAAVTSTSAENSRDRLGTVAGSATGGVL